MLRKLLDSIFGRRTNTSGARAEAFAATWLEREKGFRVITRNWRNPRDEREEIDLICRDRDVLVFVEVKARAEGALVPGYFAVNERKKRVLRRAAKAYLARMSPKPRTFRCDVVEIALPANRDQTFTPLHFENVPLFPKEFRG